MQVDNKYYFNMRIQDYSNFISPTDLIAFTMTENCGAAGVLFEVSFMTSNSKIADLIIENNEVIFELGESSEKAVSYKTHISEHPEKSISADNTQYTISFVATLIDISFYTTHASETVFGTSLDMVSKMAKTYLGTDLDIRIEKPLEVEHNWLRSYETGAITMLEAWLHMNLPKTSPILWIDTKNIAHIADIEGIKKGGVKHKFIPAQMKQSSNNDKPYINSFTTKSYKFDTNLITGKNTIVNVTNVETGDDNVTIPETKPDVASTTVVESGNVGNKVIDNKYQTDNVHTKFMACYYRNKVRLIQLSSHIGNLELMGYHPDINICDLIEVTGCDVAYAGRYLVNTKVTYFGANKPVKTVVAVCRDNTNSIENSDVTPKNTVLITNQQMTDILQSIRTLRRVTIMGTKYLDGSMKGQLMGYCKAFKYNALNSFQILGVPFNMNSSLELMQSMREIGRALINKIIDKYIPYPYNVLLKEAILNGFNFKALLMNLLAKYLPDFLRDLIAEILMLLAALVALADALHRQNNKSLSDYNYQSGGYSSNDNDSPNGNASGSPDTKDDYIPKDEDDDVPKDNTQDNTEEIKQITDEIVDNVDGIDIPIPDIGLNESESLLPKDELKEVIIDKLISYLEGQGYLDGISTSTFKMILKGKKPLDFNTIKKINGNIGNVLYARYWGTFSGEIKKLGRTIDILDKVITIPKVDITEDVYNGDSIIVAGTEKSNGTYTAIESWYDDYTENSYIKVLEDIENYHDTPIKTYTNVCEVSDVTYYEEIQDIIDGKRVTLENVSVITIPGKYNNLFKKNLSINITNLGMDGHCLVNECTFDRENIVTKIYTKTVLQDKLSSGKKIQIVVEAENGTVISKLSNHEFTEYYIKNGFKDIYNTVPCTKIVNALKGAKVWIALPDIINPEDIEFYINSQKQEMDVIGGIDLNLYAVGGAKLYYNAYMSKDTYNSNSVTLEVRRKL